MDEFVIYDIRTEMPNYHVYSQDFRRKEIIGIVIHHSGTAVKHVGLPKGDAKTFFIYHVKSLGWDRGGYNYVILANGEIEYAIDDKIPAYHAGFQDPDNTLGLEYGQYWNNNFLGICLSGWFENDRAYSDEWGRTRKIPNFFVNPTKHQMDSLIKLVRYLCSIYSISIENILGHRELLGSNTICPGSNLDMDIFRQKLLECEKGGFLMSVISKPVYLELPPSNLPILRKSGLTVSQIKKNKRLINFQIRYFVRIITLICLPITLHWFLIPVDSWVWQLRVIGVAVCLTAFVALLLRWINPPTSSFMLQAQSRLKKDGRPIKIKYHWVNYEDISPEVRLAAIAAEDPNFLEHTGFAWGHYLEKLHKLCKGEKISGGGSTISQQLIKNLFLWPGGYLFRKVLEAWITIFLEALVSKKRILEIYLNIVQFDRDVFGIGAAATCFFSKPAITLSIEEAVMLVAVLPDPLKYSVKSADQNMRKRHIYIKKRMSTLDGECQSLI